MVQQQLAPSGTQTTTIDAQPVLHLRPCEDEKDGKKKSKSKVRWTEDVVDNEHMNKKKTKICCIFHPQREFGESSDSESSSDSSDSSDSSGDEAPNNPDTPLSHGHDHHHDDEHGHVCKHRKNKQVGPNAYEKQPTYRNQSTVPEEAI